MDELSQNKVTKSFLANLDYLEEDIRLVSTTFGITFYTERVFSEIPDSILFCYKRFLNLCQKENLKFYATENMRRHKPVNKRVFNMLETWLKPDAPSREHFSLELKDGNIYQEAPKYKFKISASEKGSLAYEGKSANLVSFCFPPEFGIERSDEMLDFTKEICGHFPFQSGHAGFSFECSRYEAKTSQTNAWRKSMRYPGIDISRIPEDTKSVRQNALKTVGWLTILNDSLINDLGGIDAINSQLSNDVNLVQVANGYIFKAGDHVAIGDRNRGDLVSSYQSVFRIVKPLIEIASKQSLWIKAGLNDKAEKTEAWYKRFENE